MTTEQQILAAFDEAGHEYLDMDDLVKTQDTLENFRSASADWAEGKLIAECTYGGYAALEFDGVQAAKGQPRRALTVIDFGDARYVYSI